MRLHSSVCDVNADTKFAYDNGHSLDSRDLHTLESRVCKNELIFTRKRHYELNAIFFYTTFISYTYLYISLAFFSSGKVCINNGGSTVCTLISSCTNPKINGSSQTEMDFYDNRFKIHIIHKKI